MRKARSCDTTRQASSQSRRKCSSRICVRRSRKLVGSSRRSRFGSWSRRAASFTRVCQPPERACTGPSRAAPLISKRPATSPHFHSGFPLSRRRNASVVSPGWNGSCCRRWPSRSRGCRTISPESSSSSPRMIRRSVLLPAPFRPMNPIRPSSVSVAEASSSKTWSPYRLQAFLMSIRTAIAPRQAPGRQQAACTPEPSTASSDPGVKPETAAMAMRL